MGMQSPQSLVVAAILVPEGSPARQGQPLVQLDTGSLQRQLEEKQQELREIQGGRRNPNPSDVTWATREVDATQELIELQSRLAASTIRAPADGYVVESLVNAGAKSKRRKPVLSFVELAKTRLTVTLNAEPSPAVSPGETVTVWSPDGRGRFRARVESMDRTSGAGPLLDLIPLDLPFLRLDLERDVALQREGSAPPVAAATGAAPIGALAGDDALAIPDDGLSERVEVEVVNVDVVVVDPRGNRVTDLSRDDFELEVDGDPVAIEYFAGPLRSVAPERRESTAEGISASGLETTPTGRLLVFVDESALEGRKSDELLSRIESFLRERESVGDEVFLAAFTGALLPLRSGSGDARSLTAALAELKEIGSQGNLRARERARLEEDVRSSGKYGLATPGSPREQELKEQIRIYEDEEILRQRRMVASLRRWASTFAGVEGRKSLLVATSGLNAEPGAYLYDLLGVVGAGAPGPSGRGAQAGSTTATRLLDEVDDLLGALHDARFVVYSVTPPEAPFVSNSAEFGSLGAGATRVAPRDRTDADAAQNLARLADETGGSKFLINAALDEKIESIGADAAASYSLGFSTGPEDGFDEHRIRVRVRRPGLEVRSRSAFRRIDPTELRENSLVAAASLDVVQPGMALELVAGDPVKSGKKGSIRRYPVTVRIPIGSLAFAPVAGGDSQEARIEVRFAVSRTNGELKLGEASPVTIAIPAADLERAKLDFWPHRGEVEVGAGEARVGVLVTDVATGQWSTAALALTESEGGAAD